MCKRQLHERTNAVLKRVSLNVCVFLNTAPPVYGTDASVKTCVKSSMDNNTITTSANVCTHISMLILV